MSNTLVGVGSERARAPAPLGTAQVPLMGTGRVRGSPALQGPPSCGHRDRRRVPRNQSTKGRGPGGQTRTDRSEVVPETQQMGEWKEETVTECGGHYTQCRSLIHHLKMGW